MCRSMWLGLPSDTSSYASPCERASVSISAEARVNFRSCFMKQVGAQLDMGCLAITSLAYVCVLS